MTNNILSISKRNTTFNIIPSSNSITAWNLINNNNWEEYTFDILDKFLSKNYNYLDIGAWVGPTVLYGANLAKHVYAIEPDPIALQELQNNLNLNPSISSKITLIHAALSSQTGTSNLYKGNEYGDSTSSLIPANSNHSCVVNCMTIDELIITYNIKHFNFIKIDIEGSEYNLIPSMKKFLEIEKPTLYLSLHPPFLRKTLIRQYTCQNQLEYNYNKINKNLIESLYMYKYIYDTNGNLINIEKILNETNFQEFLFTNEKL
ncbi:FkbM family methyltransferase [Bacillus thuringiensis]|uniref:FkbM family methyltransferase n=1 Tax=Bacillus thuringiensis TaxID=1428 RepID=UPI000BFD3643|nr:FkbM family methyltransferase [Bacillus thuringiensis]PGW55256.1 methyltransferase FkbM [Bacillus thuringiensis]